MRCSQKPRLTPDHNPDREVMIGIAASSIVQIDSYRPTGGPCAWSAVRMRCELGSCAQAHVEASKIPKP